MGWGAYPPTGAGGSVFVKPITVVSAAGVVVSAAGVVDPVDANDVNFARSANSTAAHSAPMTSQATVDNDTNIVFYLYGKRVYRCLTSAASSRKKFLVIY